MTTGIVDGDWLVYECSFVGEQRTIKVTKKDNGKEFSFANRTEFYGAKKNEIGGKLSRINDQRIEKGLEPYAKDDFLIEDVQTLKGPLENILHTVKIRLDTALKRAGCNKKEIYIGADDGQRVERSTIIKYKGNRKDLLKPLLKKEVADYLHRQHGAIFVKGIEADDMLVMRAYKNLDTVVITHDKDALGQPVLSFNPQKPELGVQDGNKFGRLYLNDKGDVKGIGRLFLYYQIAYGDNVDNYKANSGNPSIKWGEKSAYKALVDCKDDKEALEALVNVYRTLYPTPMTIEGWRGNTIEVDWLYALQENLDMARMLRWEGDKLDFKDLAEACKVIL